MIALGEAIERGGGGPIGHGGMPMTAARSARGCQARNFGEVERCSSQHPPAIVKRRIHDNGHVDASSPVSVPQTGTGKMLEPRHALPCIPLTRV